MKNLKSKKLIFLHIPKNGGMTFHSLLNRNFNKEKIYDIKVINNERLSVDEFIALPQVERDKIDLLKGHMLFGLHNYFSDESEYITFLRKPEDRVLSLYHYLKKKKDFKIRNQVPFENLSFRDFVETIEIPELHNAQIRLLSGLENESEEKMLEKALYNLKHHFAFVGFQEQYDASLIMLSKKFNWGLPYYKKQNVGQYTKTSIDEETKRIINEKNRGDLRLYSKLEQEFSKNKRDYFLLPFKLYQLKIINKLYSSYRLKKLRNMLFN